jgi:hypothetical protein
MIIASDKTPYWPAALNQKMAAAYCGMSVDLFKRLCPVRPLKYTSSTWGHRYLRQRLDEWLVSLDPNVKQSPVINLGDYFSGGKGAAKRP